MGAFSQIEAKFEKKKDSIRFYEAWEKLQARQAALKGFVDPGELREFCQNCSVSYAEQDPLVLALCLEARAEAEADTVERFSTDLLVWIFLPALWKVAEQAEANKTLTPDEIAGEILSGFWEEAIKDHPGSEKLSGRLVNAGRHGVWRAIRSRRREAHAGLEAVEELEAPEGPDPFWADPWTLLCFARLEGRLSETEAELIFWTRLQDEGLEKVCALLGLGYGAGRAARTRASARIASWVASLEDRYPPQDPNLARRLRNLAQKSSRLAPFLGRSRVQNGPPDVLGE